MPRHDAFSVERTMPDGSTRRTPVPDAQLFYATIAGERTLLAVHPDQEDPESLAVSHVSTGKRVTIVTAFERLRALDIWPEAARLALARLAREVGAGKLAYRLVCADLEVAESGRSTAATKIRASEALRY